MSLGFALADVKAPSRKRAVAGETTPKLSRSYADLAPVPFICSIYFVYVNPIKQADIRPFTY